MSARVRLANEIPNLLVASNQLVLAREAFRNLVHLDDGPFEVGGSFPLEGVAGDLAALQTNGLARRPEIRSAELMVHVLEAAAAVVRSEYKPSLRAFASYTGANSYQFSFGGDWEWHWQAGVAAQWVLFEGAGRSARLLERRMQIETARAGLAELRNAVRLEIRQACLDMESARQRIAATTDNAGLAEKALAIARTRVEAGLSTSLEFAESNLALSTARLACSAALRDHAVAVARLRHAAALPDDAGSITGAQP
jgi:outer membrane protein TolC